MVVNLLTAVLGFKRLWHCLDIIATERSLSSFYVLMITSLDGPSSQFEFCPFYNTLSYIAEKNFVNINKVFFSF